jgi:hypothetical protein
LGLNFNDCQDFVAKVTGTAVAEFVFSGAQLIKLAPECFYIGSASL